MNLYFLLISTLLFVIFIAFFSKIIDSVCFKNALISLAVSVFTMIVLKNSYVSSFVLIFTFVILNVVVEYESKKIYAVVIAYAGNDNFIVWDGESLRVISINESKNIEIGKIITLSKKKNSNIFDI